MELNSDAAFFGIDPAVLQAEPAPSEGVWEEHAAAVQAFLAIQTQWKVLPRFGDRPVWIGLDHGAAEAGLRLAGIDMTSEQWMELRVIEAGAKAVLNGD